MRLTNLRVDPFTGAPSYLRILGEVHRVPSTGSPYIWLNEIPVDSTSYPITVEILASSGSAQSIQVSQDAFVAQSQPTTNTGSIGALQTGVDGIGGPYRSILAHPMTGWPSALASAKLFCYLQNTSGSGGYPNPRSIGVHRVTSSWAQNTVNWNSQPSHYVVAEDVIRTGAAGWYSWNITDMLNEHMAGNVIYHGLMLKDGNETNTDTQRDFCSREYPTVAWRPYIQIIAASAAARLSRTSSFPPTQTTFACNTSRGCIALHGVHAGAQVAVNYWGRGTNICAEVLNRLVVDQ